MFVYRNIKINLLHTNMVMIKMNVRKIGYCALVFALLTAIFAWATVYSFSRPTSETNTIIVSTYTQNAEYSYTAELLPNLIYNNKTTLHPGEGLLYLSILRQVTVTFHYSFNCTPKPNATDISYRVITEIESPAKWIRELSPEEAEQILALTNTLNFSFCINTTGIQNFVAKIDAETGTLSTNIKVNIKPEINVTAMLPSGENITDSLFPGLSIIFLQDPTKGNYLLITKYVEGLPAAVQSETTPDLTYSSTQYEIKYEIIDFPEVKQQRAIFLSSTILTATLTVILFGYYFVHRPKYQNIQKMIKPYRDLIIESTEPPMKTRKKVSVPSLDELVKAAEILATPIIHTVQEKKHIFYLINENIKYEFILQE